MISLKSLLESGEVSLAMAACWLMINDDIRVEDHRLCANRLMNRIDPGEGTESLKELGTVLHLCIQGSLGAGSFPVFHLDQLDLREKERL